MSIERHGSKYKPAHRPKGNSKTQVGKGANRGSKFYGQMVRQSRLTRRWREERDAQHDETSDT